MRLSSLGYKVSVGLEVHIGVGTKSKLFSSVCNVSASSCPNSQISFYDLALPGTLPVLDVGCTTKAALLGMLTYSFRSGIFCFVRKHYGYHDLPKGYQLSQLGEGLGCLGRVWLGEEVFGYFSRCFIEEDAGRTYYDRAFIGTSSIDLNRSGSPLLEVVTCPLFKDTSEVLLFMRKLRQLVIWSGISLGSLQDGQFRFDVNVSLSENYNSLGNKVEVKNLNSFQSLKGSLDSEVERQYRMLQAGQDVLPETRLYEPQTQQTLMIRRKEVQADYCFFLDPDLSVLPTSYFLGASSFGNNWGSLLVHWGLMERVFGSEFGFNQSYLASLVLGIWVFVVLGRFRFFLEGVKYERLLFLFLFQVLGASVVVPSLLWEVGFKGEKFLGDFRGKVCVGDVQGSESELGVGGPNKKPKQFLDDFGRFFREEISGASWLGFWWLGLGLGGVWGGVWELLDNKKNRFLSET
jgi:hypothetical protein